MKNQRILFPRAKILSVINENPNITLIGLENEIKVLSRGCLTHHIQILKKRGLITISKREKGKKGNPFHLSLTKKADPIKNETLEKIESILNIFN